MEGKWKRYHTIWAMLFLGWFISYIDRTLTGPVITWMIDNKVAFLASAANPHALGGLLGSLFFAGYMLTQFPGGYFGDKYGYRTIIIISIFWAGITTIFTGLVGGLTFFIALRVLTGLGEGVFYSNDRSLIAQVTPPEKLGLGMGFVITGLSLGLTAATLGTPHLIKFAQPFMGIDAWKAPFFIMGVTTVLVGLLLFKYMKPIADNQSAKEHYGQALMNLLKYSAVFLIAIMAIYFVTNLLGLSEVAIGFILTGLAIALILFIYKNKATEVRPVLKNRNLVLLYLSAIPILWHLWFYGFWSVSIVKDFGGGALTTAALVASFNALAGLIGFPLGGKISDMVAHKPNGRRNVLAWITACLTLSIFVFAAYLMAGNKNMIVMSIILFISGVFFFALQSVSHALTAELAPAEHRGSAFGMWNLVAEVGALLSPVVSGALRDSTGSWGSPLILDGILMGVSCLLVFSISRAKIESSHNNEKQSEAI